MKIALLNTSVLVRDEISQQQLVTLSLYFLCRPLWTPEDEPNF